jgi:hypothetical protein
LLQDILPTIPSLLTVSLPSPLLHKCSL